MTNKQRMMARGLADGRPLEEAARLAGYNLPYARKKAREPAFLQLVEQLKAKMQTTTAEERDAVARLWEIINDPTVGEAARISAVRALIAYDRVHDGEKEVGDIIIVDDIPKCEKCPLTGKDFTGGRDDGRQDNDRTGTRLDADGNPKVPKDAGGSESGDRDAAHAD